METSGLPWQVAYLIGGMLGALGFLYLIFADRICEQQLRWLQSRWSRCFFRGMGLLVIAAGAATAWGLTQPRSIRGDVIRQEKDPTGRVSAIIIRDDRGGATVATSYALYIKDAHGFDKVLVVDHIDTIRIAWNSNAELDVDMPCGRIFKYSNFFDEMNASGQFQRTISIRLNTNGLCPGDLNT